MFTQFVYISHFNLSWRHGIYISLSIYTCQATHTVLPTYHSTKVYTTTWTTPDARKHLFLVRLNLRKLAFVPLASFHKIFFKSFPVLIHFILTNFVIVLFMTASPWPRTFSSSAFCQGNKIMSAVISHIRGHIMLVHCLPGYLHNWLRWRFWLIHDQLTTQRSRFSSS